jgi:hypothetical protein
LIEGIGLLPIKQKLKPIRITHDAVLTTKYHKAVFKRRLSYKPYVGRKVSKKNKETTKFVTLATECKVYRAYLTL